MSVVSEYEISAELNRARLSRAQLVVLLLCFLVATFDGMDAQIIAFAAPWMMPDLGLANDQLGIVFAAATVGMALGAALFGYLGDLYGRKRMVVLTVFMFAVCTPLAGLANNLNELLIIRFVTGIGMGGALPNAVTLVAEYSADRQRRMMVSVMYMGFAAGGIIGSVAAKVLIESYGWQSIFYFGGVLPLLLVPFLVRFMPESMHYLVKRGDGSAQIAQQLSRINPTVSYPPQSRFTLAEAAANTRISLLFAPDRLRNTIMLWIAFFINLLVLFFLMYWTPKLLIDYGMTAKQAFNVVLVFNIGGVGGGLLLAWMSEHMDPRVTLSGYFVVAMLSAMAVGLSVDHPTLLLLCAFVMGVTAGGAQVGLYPLATQIYPTVIRVTGVSWAQSCGRVGSIIGPVAGGALVARGWGFTDSYLLFSSFLLIAAGAIFSMRLNAPKQQSGLTQHGDSKSAVSNQVG
ncbi:MAG: MFS transporter [Gammaproteobacteria bacterium]|nr:MAG: MFS transporter [Gammaproteobacteria bacterium]